MVTPDHDADLTLDLHGCSLVEVRPEREPSGGSDGYLSVIATRDGDATGGNWTFTAPPYVILGMAGGEYRFHVFDRSGPGTWQPISATIADGTASELEFPRR